MRLYFMTAIIVLSSINCNGDSQEKRKALDDVPGEKISSGLQQTLQKLEKMTNEEKINALTELTYSANNFSLNLYKKIANRSRENFVLSSFAIFQSMGLVARASTGDTKRQIQEVLNLPQDESRIFAGFKEIHQRYEKYFDMWCSYNQIDIIHNQPFTSDIKNISDRIYSVKESKFSRAERTMIMAEGRYRCVLDAEENMDPVIFSNGNGTKTKYKHYVKLTGRYWHGQLPEIQASYVEIRCMENHRKTNGSAVGPTRMFILLPNRVNGLDELEKNIERLSINKLSMGDLYDVDITVPEMYPVDYSSISDDLIGMGLTNMFRENFEISLTTRQNKIYMFMNFGSFQIGKYRRPIFVSVTEKSIGMRFTTTPKARHNVRKVTIDRPFIAIITTTDENPLILHMARITSLK